MSKQTETLKLALEALSPWAGEDANHTEQYAAYHALREALAEQKVVLPGGGHVTAVPVAVYGYCPECGGAGVMRERRPNGNDKCTNGHKYPSSKALAEQPAQQQEPATLLEAFKEFGEGWESLAWELCADENGEEACSELIWEGGPIPEPWGDRWLKYEDEAKRMIALVHKHTSPPASKPWVGLTYVEWQEIDAGLNGKRDLARIFVRAIEAKLQEKNA